MRELLSNNAATGKRAMSDLVFGERHDHPLEEALHLISRIIDGVVTQQCARHYGVLTQEHQFTSGLAEPSSANWKLTPLKGCNSKYECGSFLIVDRDDWRNGRVQTSSFQSCEPMVMILSVKGCSSSQNGTARLLIHQSGES